jgi:tRNA 2-selenouridine synthase
MNSDSKSQTDPQFVPGSRLTVPAEKFWQIAQNKLLIDVRSPGEFAEDHIPGAINIPLFENEERAEIGTLYQKSGHDEAVLRGLEIVGPKMRQLVAAVEKAKFDRADANSESVDKEVFVHCWRGGMRSQSFGWLLETAGWNVKVLQGGYKGFRQIARQTIENPHRLIVLSGLTGAGKTVHLQRLIAEGEQVLDLEKLANHRGSAFGGIGQGDQPTTKQFENVLFEQLDSFDSEKRIWVEDEGNRIGRVVVPDLFHKQLRNAPAIFLDVDWTTRVDHLMSEYGDLEHDCLAVAVEKIGKRFGSENVAEALDAINAGDIRGAVELTLSYYDRTYLRAVEKMLRVETVNLPTENLSIDQQIAETIRLASELVSSTPVKSSVV